MRPSFFLRRSAFLLLFLLSAPLGAQENGPALYVGVRALPEYLSPALAFTDAERQAVELLFERLVEPVADEQLGQRYRPRLAATLPRVSPLHREFRIRPGARWPDGSPVTTADVRNTVSKLKGEDWTGRSALWNDLLELRFDAEPSLVRIQFGRGHFEPLSLLTFPILPQNFRKEPLRPDNVAFAKAPVGSGPYYLEPQRIKADGREYLVFRPHKQEGRSGKEPTFKEIRLFALKDPLKEFQHATKPMHVWLDAPTGEVKEVRKAGVAEIRTSPSRGVYFLAVNHRVPALASVDLRRAIAHGINRETVLDKHFRAGENQWHTALNGPYPVKSWAYNSTSRALKADPFNPELAKSEAKLALKEAPEVSLSLKYPDDDPRVLKACADMQAQLAPLKIHLKLVALSPRRLKEAVDERAYELAYYHLDYPDETFTLWPLFDTSPAALRRGGANYLGYEDFDLKRLFDNVLEHRQFSLIQKLTREIHAHLYEKMPLIPLWQLHTHIALRGVDPGRLDAQRVFANVEGWKLIAK